MFIIVENTNLGWKSFDLIFVYAYVYMFET